MKYNKRRLSRSALALTLAVSAACGLASCSQPQQKTSSTPSSAQDVTPSKKSSESTVQKETRDETSPTQKVGSNKKSKTPEEIKAAEVEALSFYLGISPEPKKATGIKSSNSEKDTLFEKVVKILHDPDQTNVASKLEPLLKNLDKKQVWDIVEGFNVKKESLRKYFDVDGLDNVKLIQVAAQVASMRGEMYNIFGNTTLEELGIEVVQDKDDPLSIGVEPIDKTLMDGSEPLLGKTPRFAFVEGSDGQIRIATNGFIS